MKTETGIVRGGADAAYRACREILEREAELLVELEPVQDAVAQAVLLRKWEGFEVSVELLAELSGRFEALEEERRRVFAELGGEGEGEARFYALAARLAPGERREITDLYRELKGGSLRIRNANSGLLAYLNEARAVVGSFLDAVLPGRAGPAYSRRGDKILQDMRSMVLNHSF